MRRSFVIKSLPLVLIVFTVFTVSLTENLQIADAGFLSKSTAGWQYELSPGESQVLTWTLKNTEEVPINIEFRAEGQGSELFIFEELVTMESKEKTSFEFIVTVPKDHPDNIEYRPVLYALEVAKRDSEGGAAILINYQMSAKPVVKIGDNPVFTPEAIVIVEEEPEPEPTARPSQEDFKLTPEETLEEKLVRIQESNQAKEVKVDDIFEEEFEEEAVVEYEPEPEYILEPEVKQVPLPIEEEVKECDFITLILSWIGLAKC